MFISILLFLKNIFSNWKLIGCLTIAAGILFFGFKILNVYDKLKDTEIQLEKAKSVNEGLNESIKKVAKINEDNSNILKQIQSDKLLTTKTIQDLHNRYDNIDKSFKDIKDGIDKLPNDTCKPLIILNTIDKLQKAGLSK